MKIFENGKLIKNTRNDLHNTYSVKNHKPTQSKMQRPFYKNLYEGQLKVNKGLLWVIGTVLLLGILYGLGCQYRITTLKNEIGALQRDWNISQDYLNQYRINEEYLLKENASCSAKLNNSRLSYKAKTHMKQQPIVAEKIKYTFGNDWVEATELISRESSLKVDNVNPSSGACGLVQFLPCSKLKCSLTDLDCQLVEGKKYIASRYGSPMAALFHHDMKGWY